MNKLHFDVVTKLCADDKHICTYYKDGDIFETTTKQPYKLGYNSYFGFTSRGYHFSKKKHSLYPLNLLAIKSNTKLPLNLDVESLKDFPPSPGEFIIYLLNDKNEIKTWCHSTLLFRRIFNYIRNRDTIKDIKLLENSFNIPNEQPYLSMFYNSCKNIADNLVIEQSEISEYEII